MRVRCRVCDATSAIASGAVHRCAQCGRTDVFEVVGGMPPGGGDVMPSKVSADTELRELGAILRCFTHHTCACGFFITRTCSLDAVASMELGDSYSYVRVCDTCDAGEVLSGLCSDQDHDRAAKGLRPVKEVVRDHVVSVEHPTAKLARRHRALLVGE